MKGPKPNAFSSKSQGKQKQGENPSSEKTESENNSHSKPPKSSYEEEDSSENGAHHSKRMNELKKRLEAIANRSNLQEARIVRPYPAEWDAAPYPLSSKHRPYIPLTVKGHQTSIYTTSNSKPRM